MNKETKEEVKETKKDEVIQTEETQKENEVKKDETTEKPSKSFLDTISGIWNSKPVRFIRKATKVTLITGAALIGVTGAAKAGAAMAIEAKTFGGSDSEEIPDEIPGDYEDVEDVPVDSNSEES